MTLLEECLRLELLLAETPLTMFCSLSRSSSFLLFRDDLRRDSLIVLLTGRLFLSLRFGVAMGSEVLSF